MLPGGAVGEIVCSRLGFVSAAIHRTPASGPVAALVEEKPMAIHSLTYAHMRPEGRGGELKRRDRQWAEEPGIAVCRNKSVIILAGDEGERAGGFGESSVQKVKAFLYAGHGAAGLKDIAQRLAKRLGSFESRLVGLNGRVQSLSHAPEAKIVGDVQEVRDGRTIVPGRRVDEIEAESTAIYPDGCYVGAVHASLLLSLAHSIPE
jgi:hypothetical protein